MGPVVVALVFVTALIAVGLAFAWQERRPTPGDAVVYGVEESLDFITVRLADSPHQLKRNDVRRILEWEVRFLQSPDLRGASGGEAVVGGLDAAGYAQQQLHARGHTYDGAAILEVLDLQAAYLASIGAVGEPVAADEIDKVIGAE